MMDPQWFPAHEEGTQPEPGKIEDDMDYEERIFHYAWGSGNDDPHLMEFRLLNRINIFHLQNELAKLKGAVWRDMKATQEDMAKLKTMLHDYANAVRDFEYLRSLPEITGSQAAERRLDLTAAFTSTADLPGDPYNSRYCTFPAPSHPEVPVDSVRRFLQKHLPKRLTYTPDEMRTHMEEYLNSEPPKIVSPFVDKVARFVISLIGGAWLIVPMLVMSLPTQNTTKSLIVTSVAVTLFAGMMALVMKASNAETLVATATYAAVLVVFVGTSS